METKNNENFAMDNELYNQTMQVLVETEKKLVKKCGVNEFTLKSLLEIREVMCIINGFWNIDQELSDVDWTYKLYKTLSSKI